MTTTQKPEGARTRTRAKKRKPLNVHQLVAEAMLLSPHDRVLLIQQLAYSLLAARLQATDEPRRSIMDSLAHLGYEPTGEEIEATRHEGWCGHPCEHDTR